MQASPEDHLEVLARLALEYEEKYKQLEELLHGADPGASARQLQLQAEWTTDRFRGAQQALLAELVRLNPKAEGPSPLQAGIILCRCFDEMRILFQMLLTCRSHPDASGEPS